MEGHDGVGDEPEALGIDAEEAFLAFSRLEAIGVDFALVGKEALDGGRKLDATTPVFVGEFVFPTIGAERFGLRFPKG